MFRHSGRPPRGTGSVARQLSRLRSGTRVELFFGAIFVKAVRKWQLAGTIGDPVTSTALAKLNGGICPVLLVPAWVPAGEVTL